MLKGRDALEALPELPLEPFELAGRLGHAGDGPYLTIVPHARPVPEPAPPVGSPVLPHAPQRQSHQIREYWAQALHPYVYCVFPGDLLDGVLLEPARVAAVAAPHAEPVSRPAPGTIVPAAQHYKLSAFEGRRLQHLLFCTVKYGPWAARVIETESCIDGVPNRWELKLVGVPLDVGMTWNGTWLDQPTLPNLEVIKGNLALSHVTTQCCPGNKWCHTSQSCIPLQVNCQPNQPA